MKALATSALKSTIHLASLMLVIVAEAFQALIVWRERRREHGKA